MSLVNDMLRDLEQRNEKSAPVPGNAAGVKAAQYVEARPQGPISPARYALWLVGVFAVAAIVWLLWQQYAPLQGEPLANTTTQEQAGQNTSLVTQSLDSAQPEAVNQAEAASALREPEEVETPLNAVDETVPEERAVESTLSTSQPQQDVVVTETIVPLTAISKVEIESIEWAGGDLGGDLVVKLSDVADIQLLNQDGRSIKVAFEDVDLGASLPLISSRLISELNVDKEGERIVLSLTSSRSSQFSFRVQQSPTTLILGVLPDLNEVAVVTPKPSKPQLSPAAKPVNKSANQPVLVDEVADKQASSPEISKTSPVTAPVKKSEPQPVTKAKAQLTDAQTVKRASSLVDRGDISQARSLLRTRIAESPDTSVNTRNFLATLLLSTGETSKAQTQVSAGLKLHPENTGFKKLQGRIWIANGQSADVVKLLAQNGPSVSQDVEYHELLATAYQQEQQFNEAAQAYFDLLQVDQNVPRWWIGMGYSLELGQHFAEARSAYESALSIPSIGPNLRTYAEQRANALARR